MFREILDFYTRNSDEEIDSIEDGSRELGTISFYLRFAADTLLFFVSEKSAWTRIEGTYEYKLCRIIIARIDSIDAYLAIFERLSEHLEEFPWELEEFIEKEYSLVSEANLARTTLASSAYYTHSTCRMVHFAKWPREYERMVFREESGDRIYLRYIDDFREIHIREYSGKGFRKHGFSGAWRSFHEDIVPTCSRYRQSPFGMLLSDYMLESCCLYARFILLYEDLWIDRRVFGERSRAR